VRTDGLESHRRSAGEVTVRARGLRTYAVPGTTDTLRQAAAEAAVATHRLGAGHRTAVLRETGRQNADRHADTRHVAQRRIV